MSTDLSKYKAIIQQLRGLVGKRSFDSKFTSATKALSKTDKFLLKMELSRLASPSTRLVDLRGLVDGECRLFEHGEKAHYLDDIAITVFNEQVDHYGLYSTGVYEAVTNTKNNFRVLYKNEQANLGDSASGNKVLEKTQYPASLHKFGHYYNRSEERMNFVIQLELVLDKKTKVAASTVDLSVNGCLFRLSNEKPLTVEQKIQIRLVGLEEEFSFGDDNYFDYSIKNIKQDGDTQLVGCQCIFKNERDSFKKFLQGFVQGNKRRYKINLDNSISALKARSFEQFIMPKISELPIFVEQTKAEVVPRYVLSTSNNQSSYQYWQDEDGNTALDCLLGSSRVELVKKLARSGRTLLVYSFIHQSQNKSFFYTADNKQLSEDKSFMTQFLAFAADKESFMVTELSYQEVNIDKGFLPLTVANSLKVKDQHLNRPLSKAVREIVQKLPFIITASDITTPSLIADFQQLSFTGIAMSKVKTFGHKRHPQYLVVEDLGINYKNHRHEERFIYKTGVVVECERVEWSGMSHDFSVSGLKIELDKSSVLTVGDIVYLSFPSLQKITAAFDLSKLPYEIVQINKKKTIINLRVHIKKHQHIGRSFFKLLIEKNQSKLTVENHTITERGLSEALRCIYASSTEVPTLVIQASGSRYKLEALACSGEYGSFLAFMRKFSDRKNAYNLYPLLNSLQVADLFNNCMKKMTVSELPTNALLFVSVLHGEERVDKAVSSKLDSEFKNYQQRAIFIKNALKNGDFFAVKLAISRTNQPDMEFLNPELNYISSYAIHRGKQIEQEIWSVAGIIQLFDVTQETLLRNKLLS